MKVEGTPYGIQFSYPRETVVEYRERISSSSNEVDSNITVKAVEKTKTNMNKKCDTQITYPIKFDETKNTFCSDRMVICKIVRMSEGNPPELVAAAASLCHENDNFCKDTGRKIALDRALKAYLGSGSESKQIRTKFWNTYLSNCRRVSAPRKRKSANT